MQARQELYNWAISQPFNWVFLLQNLVSLFLYFSVFLSAIFFLLVAFGTTMTILSAQQPIWNIISLVSLVWKYSAFNQLYSFPLYILPHRLHLYTLCSSLHGFVTHLINLTLKLYVKRRMINSKCNSTGLSNTLFIASSNILDLALCYCLCFFIQPIGLLLAFLVRPIYC
jgi:hypothetical protein